MWRARQNNRRGPWSSLATDARPILAMLDGFWQRASQAIFAESDPGRLDAVRVWHRRAEDLIAMQLTIVIRELLSRLMGYLLLILGMIVLMVTAISSFPIQPKQPLLAFTWAYVTVAIAAVS